MKTLIWNGSPRKNGDTVSLLEQTVNKLDGEYKIVNAYFCKVSPCMDCRFCWSKAGCSIQDEMQEIYDYIQECDNILLVSPIYFSELTGKLLDLGSRLQIYYSARFFRREEPVPKLKKGAVILIGGGDGHMDKAYETACTLLHHMNCHDIFPLVYSHNTNNRPVVKDPDALNGINNIVRYFNQAEEK